LVGYRMGRAGLFLAHAILSIQPDISLEVLNNHLSEDPDRAGEIACDLMIAYNGRRPHDALVGLPPVAFREQQNSLALY